jgi:hypothetical protein
MSADAGIQNNKFEQKNRAGVAQLVELQPSKLTVASSSLVSRSMFSFLDPARPSIRKIRNRQQDAHVAQTVERFLGKEEVHRFDSGRGLHLFYRS